MPAPLINDNSEYIQCTERVYWAVFCEERAEIVQSSASKLFVSTKGIPKERLRGHHPAYNMIGKC